MPCLRTRLLAESPLAPNAQTTSLTRIALPHGLSNWMLPRHATCAREASRADSILLMAHCGDSQCSAVVVYP